MLSVCFWVGRSWYKRDIPYRNIVTLFFKCSWVDKAWKSSSNLNLFSPQHALSRRKYGVPGSHWLEAASDKYDMDDIDDFKAVYRVGFFFLFYPMYWSLFDQQGSQWTIQAMRMDGNTWGVTILPDQFQVVNPILILVCIPLFNRVIYPGLGKEVNDLC